MTPSRPCARCSNLIIAEECTTCDECKNNYHFECSINETQFNKLRKNKKLWKCLYCVGTVTRNRTNSSSTITQDVVEPYSVVKKNEASDIKEILSMLTGINTKLDQMDKELGIVKESVTFMSTQYDDVIKMLTNNAEEINTVKKEVAFLKSQNDEKDVLINNINERLQNFEQYSRNRNVEIFGIKEVEGENCKVIVANIAKELQLSVSIEDIDVAHRLPSNRRNATPSIVAQFKTRSARDTLVEKKVLVITNNNMPGVAIGEKIFINEQLTYENKQLLRKTKEFAKSANYRYVWFKNGKLLVRKDNGCPAIRIMREEDLPRKLIVSSSI